MNSFGQLIIGPPGSGKTTYCHTVSKFLESIDRKVAVINVGYRSSAVEDSILLGCGTALLSDEYHSETA